MLSVRIVGSTPTPSCCTAASDPKPYPKDFRSPPVPPRWFNPLLNRFRGGGNITGTVQQDPHFIVWMRLAPLPTLRKLWAVMPTQNLIAGDQLQLTVSNRYNSFAFDGKKSIVLSTTTWLGTYNSFLGSVFLAVGGAAVAAAFAYVITATWIKPRRLGDLSVLPASEWSSAH